MVTRPAVAAAAPTAEARTTTFRLAPYDFGCTAQASNGDPLPVCVPSDSARAGRLRGTPYPGVGFGGPVPATPSASIWQLSDTTGLTIRPDRPGRRIRAWARVRNTSAVTPPTIGSSDILVVGACSTLVDKAGDAHQDFGSCRAIPPGRSVTITASFEEYPIDWRAGGPYHLVVHLTDGAGEINVQAISYELR